MEAWFKVVFTHMVRTEPEIIEPRVPGMGDLLRRFLGDGLKLRTWAAFVPHVAGALPVGFTLRV